MKELENRLKRELQQDVQIEIHHQQQWNLPVQVLKVDFETVQQTKMDVLMKMLLIAFRESDLQNSNQLSEVLLVEPIFIQNISERMLRAGLIEKKDATFTVTEKGIEQLKSEIFIDQHEEQTEEVLYSPCHNRFFAEEIEEDANDTLEDYRLYDQYADWTLESLNKTKVQETLQQMQQVEETENIQKIVNKIHAITRLHIEVMPCIEFQLYHKEKDVFYARVWNAFLSEWDETMENQLNDHDRQAWREQFVKG